MAQVPNNTTDLKLNLKASCRTQDTISSIGISSNGRATLRARDKIYHYDCFDNNMRLLWKFPLQNYSLIQYIKQISSEINSVVISSDDSVISIMVDNHSIWSFTEDGEILTKYQPDIFDFFYERLRSGSDLSDQDLIANPVIYEFARRHEEFSIWLRSKIPLPELYKKHDNRMWSASNDNFINASAKNNTLDVYAQKVDPSYSFTIIFDFEIQCISLSPDGSFVGVVSQKPTFWAFGSQIDLYSIDPSVLLEHQLKDEIINMIENLRIEDVEDAIKKGEGSEPNT